MAIVLNDNINAFAPKPLDDRQGPWANVATANASILLAQRFKGLTVGIIVGGKAVEYWYEDGITDSDLVLKTGSGGGAINFQYSRTLFVDALNGDDATAEDGNLTLPYKTINAAITAAMAASGSTEPYTVHVFAGEYTDAGMTIGDGHIINLHLAAGVDLTVTAAGDDPWIVLSGSTLNIAGAGRAASNITCDLGVIDMRPTTNQPVVNISNMNITSLGGGSAVLDNYCIKNVGGALNIDNATISMPTDGVNRQYVIDLSGGTVSIKSSLLSFKNNNTTFKFPTTSFSSDRAWVIYEREGADVEGRIKLHQTTLASTGTGGGFICTNTSSTTSSILLDGTYFYTSGVTANIYTLFSDSNLKDKCYMNSMSMSSGYDPYGVMTNQSWVIYPTALPVSLLHTRVVTAPPY